MWGKSPRWLPVTAIRGKPCVLKCQIGEGFRAARPGWQVTLPRFRGLAARLLQQCNNQINDNHPAFGQDTESGLQACSFFISFHSHPALKRVQEYAAIPLKCISNSSLKFTNTQIN